jgi:hypothetical protein
VAQSWRARKAAAPPKDLLTKQEEWRSFPTFLRMVWAELGLPEPTPVQLDMADFLEKGGPKIMVQAFRGVGKSWITAAFVVWLLYWDPQVKILIVSASAGFARNITTFILQIIRVIPALRFLDCEGRERHSREEFDVGPARADKQPSVKSIGITGQLTGNRANFIVSDDVETLNNSLTQLGRERLKEAVKEYDAIIVPGGRICYLGTPQSEESVYNELPERRYAIRLWPSEYPDAGRRATYGPRLAPMLAEHLDSGRARAGDATDPMRFPEMELEAKRASDGRSRYALQYLLDTSLSDAERFPLRLRDLIVLGLNADTAPEQVMWSDAPQNQLRDLEAAGFSGDRLYGGVVPPDTQWGPYQGSVLFVDPSGTGKDETAYAVVRMKNGLLYVPEVTGLQGGYSDATMVAIATAAKKYKVGRVLVEANFGDGMFEKLLEPHLQRIYPCMVESVKVTVQKERRIIDSLEPVMNQHRLVICTSVVQQDGVRERGVEADRAGAYRLFYQLTHLTRERGCLAHDDRLDALAGAVRYWLDAMGRGVDKAVERDRQKQFDSQLRQFMRDMDVSGVPVEPGWIDGNAGASSRRN